MEEHSEIPQKEQVVVPPELAETMQRAESNVITEVAAPHTDILERTAHLGFADAMKEAVIPHSKKMMEVKFKDFKAAGMAALSLVPLLSQGASAARAAEKSVRLEKASVKAVQKVEKAGMGASAEAVAKMEAKYAKALKARAAFEDALSLRELNALNYYVDKGMDLVSAARMVKLPAEKFALFEKEAAAGVKLEKAFVHATRGVDTLAAKSVRVLGKEKMIPTGKIKYVAMTGAENVGRTWVHKTLHRLDPYPDVPTAVSLVGFLDLIPGVEGAELIPAAWQMVANKAQMAKEQFGMARDVTKVVLSRMGIKFNTLREPRVGKAAAEFIPAPAGT